MFTLRSKTTKELASIYAESNGDAEFCNSVAYKLDRSKDEDNVWVVVSREVAQYAADNNTPWYNASYTTPQNDYVGDWEIVELTIKD